jgi:6-phosphogluconolactonase
MTVVSRTDPECMLARKSVRLPGGGRVLVYPPEAWARMSALRVHARIARVLAELGECSVALTGGRSAAALYSEWAKLPGFRTLNNVFFYFGDERCVAPDHPESNFGLAMRTLFADGVPDGCSAIRMEAESEDREAASICYAKKLPSEVDVLLLGVGADGHIASIFPGDPAARERGRRVLAVVGEQPPAIPRLTITSSVVAEAKYIFVLAPGKSKSAVLRKAVCAPDHVDAFPARLTLRGEWFIDEDLGELNEM